jgi:hypothetical protein
MAKHKRYTTVKYLLIDGRIKSFRDIFDEIPKSVVARDLGINNVRFSKMLDNVELFLFKDVYRFAEKIEVEGKILIDLIDQEYMDKKRKQ